MSIFAGPNDKGVGEQEGLALIEEVDLRDWWFRYLFRDDESVGLARRLNPDGFYCAARWEYNDVPRDVLRHSFMRLSSGKTQRPIFARPVDWGPNERTKRVLDISPGAATALKVNTDDIIRGDLILPTLT